ncbi:hypothetical protein A4H97_14770 [Niastella yeongjuensis]|uniref:DUF5362 domain-containing protein n=1 Tax=Niastella yeongjuensis TaxID=354355 RepID=A0A1V9E450_9BACT|nr:DUF5362 family protein [Niastella yeongjuensis]OQP40869.1 hypothetical protein A4H97_14770 [Niastella yeongjuensis]SEO99353.1 hypothetical protein SAMN05660816_04097 [Niastella yeongjuensis]
MEPYNQAAATPNENLFELQVDQQSISYLGETARWAKFLSIVGFVVCGIMILFALFFGSIMATIGRISSNSDSFSSALGVGNYAFSAVYIIIALLYFFPCLYLFNFSAKMQMALRNNDQTNLNTAFGNLKSCFKFVGILTIVVLSFYLLGTVVVVSVASLVK